MKKTFRYSIILMIIFCGISLSCTNQNKGSNETAKMENTLQSVSYFKDMVGYDPQEILNYFQEYNEAIAKIGYPDAGYELWLIQEDTADVRFMVEGHWPNQEIYNEIHEHPLYQEVSDNNADSYDGMVWMEYHRFIKVK